MLSALDHAAFHRDTLRDDGFGDSALRDGASYQGAPASEPSSQNCRVAAAPPRLRVTARIALKFARPALRAIVRLTLRTLRQRVGL